MNTTNGHLPWFRLYSEILSDRKITRICARTGQPKYAVVGFWVSLLSIANESPERGLLLISDGISLDKEEIFLECGIDCETGKALLQEFIGLRMIDLDEDGIYAICHWDNRQFASDSSTERVRRHREKKREETGNDTPEPEVTTPASENGSGTLHSNDTPENMKRFSNVGVTPPESDTDPYTESDTSKDGVPPVSSSSPPDKLDSPSDKKLLEPDTPETQLLFEKLNQNRQAIGRGPAKRFKSLEQKDKCVRAAKRLGYSKFEAGLETAFSNGIAEIDRLVNWIAKYNGATNGYNKQQPFRATQNQSRGQPVGKYVDPDQAPDWDPFAPDTG